MDNGEKISINDATKEELVFLNGIGEKKAEAIVDYREKNGKFENIEDIKNIKGIGEATYNKIKDHITLRDKKNLKGLKILPKIASLSKAITTVLGVEYENVKEFIDALVALSKTAIEVKTEEFENKKIQLKEWFREKKEIAVKKVMTPGKKIAELSRSALNLLKKKLNFEKGTLFFKALKTSADVKITEMGNNIIETAGKINSAIDDKEADIKAAVDLAKEQVDIKKADIKVAVELLKENISIKLYPLKAKINRKFEHAKTVITRKPAMEIALFKEDLAKKMKSVADKFSVENLQTITEENKKRIEELKQQKQALIDQYYSHEEVETRARAM